jgi:DNA-binding response OmpR family regulator
LAQSLACGLRADGFDVDLAHDGITGRAMALRGTYDVVVLDILLPAESAGRPHRPHRPRPSGDPAGR